MCRHQANVLMQTYRYVMSLFFLNALSRIGLSHQLKYDPASHEMRADLLAKPIVDDTFIGGTKLYDERNASAPLTRFHYQQYKYCTAWTLAKKAQYMSLALLCVHVFLALIHILTNFWAKRAFTAWGTFNELMVLAYHSAPRSAAFKNCSGGIDHLSTVEKPMRVGTRMLYDWSVGAELVVCDDESGAGDVVADRKYN